MSNDSLVLKIMEIDNIGDLENYGYGYFKQYKQN